MGSVRWSRVFFVSTVVLGGALVWVLRERSEKPVSFRLEIQGLESWVLERTSTLRHPPRPDAPEFKTLRSASKEVVAELLPAHYLVTLVLEGGVTLAVPLPLFGEADSVFWKLPLPPTRDFVPIPDGPFLLGPGGAVEETGLFYAALHEVTVEEYGAFVASLEGKDGVFRVVCTDAERQAYPTGCPGHGDLEVLQASIRRGEARWPVRNVNWYDALAYARWQTTKNGIAGWEFRLPTAKEWSKLSRGTDGRIFPWGNEPRPDPFRSRKNIGVEPVDTARDRCSPYGVFHTEGNVAEWTFDAADPTGRRRVVKGRSWSGAADEVRIEGQLGDPASRRSPDLGFRLVAKPVSR